MRSRSFIAENFLYGTNDGGLKDHASFLANGLIDSTGVLELVSFVEGQVQHRRQGRRTRPGQFRFREQPFQFHPPQDRGQRGGSRSPCQSGRSGSAMRKPTLVNHFLEHSAERLPGQGLPGARRQAPHLRRGERAWRTGLPPASSCSACSAATGWPCSWTTAWRRSSRSSPP